MKTFTRLFTLLVIATLSNFSMAQTNDIAVIDVIVANSGGSVPEGYSTPVLWRMVNLGDNIPAGTDFTAVVSNSATPVIGPLTGSFSGAVANGDTVLIQTTGVLYTFSEPNGNLENVCVTMALPTIVETDSTNNIFCKTYTIDSTLSDDVQVAELTLIDPERSDLHKFDIDADANTPPSIEHISMLFINNGDLPVFNREYNFELTFDNGSDAYNAGFTQFNPGDTVTFEIEDLGLDVPKVAGTYEICFGVTDPNDVPSNDYSCVSFDIYNTPFGIDENLENNVDLFISNSVIGFVNNPSPELNAQIIDMSGKVLKAELVNSSNLQISINDLPAGTYVINVQDARSGQAFSQKFTKL